MDFFRVVNTPMNKKLLEMKTGNRLTQSGKVSVFSESSLNVAKYQNTYEAITLAIKTQEHESEAATNFPVLLFTWSPSLALAQHKIALKLV